MAKNTNKKGKNKKEVITFTMPKQYFKKMLKDCLKHTFSKDYNLLHGLLFKMANNIFYMVGTDGNTLLEAKYDLEDQEKIADFEVVIQGKYLHKLDVKRSYDAKRGYSLLDEIEITIKEDEAQIKDESNNIVYTLPYENRLNYPNYGDFLYNNENKDKFLEIFVNPQLLGKIENMKAGRGCPVRLLINKTNTLSPIYCINAKGNIVQEQMVIMPCNGGKE